MKREELRDEIQRLQIAEAIIILYCLNDKIAKDKPLTEKLLKIGHEIDDKILSLLEEK